MSLPKIVRMFLEQEGFPSSKLRWFFEEVGFLGVEIAYHCKLTSIENASTELDDWDIGFFKQDGEIYCTMKRFMGSELPYLQVDEQGIKELLAKKIFVGFSENHESFTAEEMDHIRRFIAKKWRPLNLKNEFETILNQLRESKKMNDFTLFLWPLIRENLIAIKVDKECLPKNYTNNRELVDHLLSLLDVTKTSIATPSQQKLAISSFTPTQNPTPLCFAGAVLHISKTRRQGVLPCTILSSITEISEKKWTRNSVNIFDDFSKRLEGDPHNIELKCVVGICCLEGIGTMQDVARGIALCTAAANPENDVVHHKGLPEAQHTLATWLHSGHYVPQDIPEAIRLYELAVKQKYAPSQHSLAACYKNGDGVPQDILKARMLYELAAKQSYSPAKEALTELLTGLTSQLPERTTAELLQPQDLSPESPAPRYKALITGSPKYSPPLIDPILQSQQLASSPPCVGKKMPTDPGKLAKQASQTNDRFGEPLTKKPKKEDAPLVEVAISNATCK